MPPRPTLNNRTGGPNIFRLATVSRSGLMSADHVGGLIATNEPTGFPNRTDSTLSWVIDTGVGTFTIEPTSTSYTFWQQGTGYTKSTAESIIITDVSGTHAIYYDAGVLSQEVNSSENEFDELILNKVLVALIYWNETDNLAPIVADERHGTIMSGRTHERFHDIIGAAFDNGFAASGYILETETDAALTFEVSDGELSDEDIELNIADAADATGQYEQILSGQDAEIPVLYRDTNLDWKEQAASTLPWLKTGAGGEDRLAYDNNGTLTEVTDGKWVGYTLVATNDWQYPIKMVVGQAQYTTKATATESATEEILALSPLPSQEFVFLYRFVMQTKDSYGGTYNAKIVDVTDFRGSQISGASVVGVDHGTLFGLGDPDHTA